MDLNLTIKDLSLKQLEKIRFKCIECDYWFKCDKHSFFKELSKIKDFNGFKILLKSKLFEEVSRKEKRKKIMWFKENGGKVKAAFSGGNCIGIVLAGKYHLFPRLRDFNVFPPDEKSVILGCIHVVPEYSRMGVEKRLLVEIEKELVKEKVRSIESVGKRLNDDIDKEEYNNSPLVPFKFLINNGFYLKKNDPFFPLLRLDLKSIAVSFIENEELLGKMALKEEVRSPIIIKNK